MRPSFPTPQCLQPVCHPSKLSPRTKRIRGTIQVKLCFQSDGFLTGFFEEMVYFLNQGTKRNDWSFTWFSKTPLVWSLPIRQEILNVSQISTAFHGICPPFSIQTPLQQYCRRTFLHSAYCSFSNLICFRPVWCRRKMILVKIFTSFAHIDDCVEIRILHQELCYLL